MPDVRLGKTEHRGAQKHQWLQIALIFLVCFIHGGAPPPHLNETHYLTKAKHYWDPAWCAGDLFLESADAHLTFYWTVGWLTKFFSLPTVAWIGRVVAWGLLAWSWQRLSRRVLTQPFAGVLSAALLVWLVGEKNFAGEWVVGGVEAKCFAYAGVFAGLAAVADARWNRAWPWFGMAGAFHVLVGGWSAIAAGLVWLVEPRQARSSLQSMLPSLGLGLVLALPGMVPALQLTSGISAETSREAAQVYVFDRLPHHLAPLTLPSDQLMMRTKRFALPLLVFVLLWWQWRMQRQDRSQCAENAAVALERICRFAAWTFLISMVGLLWEVICWNHPALAAVLLKYYWFRLADVGVPLAASLLSCYWIERLAVEKRKLAPLALALAMTLPSWHLVNVSVSRWKDPTPPADAKLASAPAWHEACDWVRGHTAKEALFLVPRGAQTLSWNAERKSLVTWKDVPQDAASLITWRDRYFTVFWHFDSWGDYVPYRSLARQGTTRIRELALKYGVDYVITREYPPLELPVAYSNAWYTVYAVSPAAEEALP